jgi:hypothetical protein
MCPSGWLYSNDHCYKHFSEASKEDANRICLKHNSFLLKIENKLEVKVLEQNKNFSEVWVNRK